MNKNTPMVMFFYLSSIMMATCLDTWFPLWMMLEMNTLTIISLMMLLNFFNFIEKTMCYYIMQTLSSMILLLSLSISILSNTQMTLNLMFFGALILKMGGAPFHIWLIPIAMQATWNFLAMLIILQKIIPLILMEMMEMSLTSMTMLLISLSCLMSTSLNMSSKNLKQALVNNSISSTGWTLLGLFLSFNMWKTYIIIYTLNIFFISLSKNKNTKINQKKNKTPLIAILSSSGMPPLIGFFPKLFILQKMIVDKSLLFTLMILFLSTMDMYLFVKLFKMPMFNKMSKKKWIEQTQDLFLLVFLLVNFMMVPMML